MHLLLLPFLLATALVSGHQRDTLPAVHALAEQPDSLVASAPAAATAATLEEQDERMNERLRFLWDRYLDQISLLVSLLTGIITFSVGLLRLDPSAEVVNRDLFRRGMIYLLLALGLALLLRVLAQYFMEVEVFGNRGAVDAYFARQGVTPFTTSYTRGTPSLIKGLSAVGWMLILAISFSMCCGLYWLSVFAYDNLPASSREGPKRDLFASWRAKKP